MSAETKPRTYRFSARDAAGLLLGMQAAQCVVLGAGILVSGVLLNIGAHPLLVLAPLLIGVAIAFGRVHREPLYELLPVAAACLAERKVGQHEWRAPFPRFRESRQPVADDPVLPPSFGDIHIRELDDAEWTRRGRVSPAATVWDHRRKLASIVLRARGPEFVLRDRDEQERLLQGWGDALAGFCRERRLITSVRWAEWAAPTSLDAQLHYLNAHQKRGHNTPETDAYAELLRSAGEVTVRHDVLIVLTLDARRARVRSRTPVDVATDRAVSEEARLLSDRMRTAGMTIDLPLTASEIAAATRQRLDPFSPIAAGSASLSELTGVVSPHNAGPLAVDNHWDHVRVDGSVHTAYVIAEWPRLELPPNWLEPLLLHSGSVRTIAVHYEPVPPSRSQRQVERDSTRLGSDEEQRLRTGFRIGARHRRAQSDLEERESELVAGYVELQYAGFVIVSSRDLDALREDCAQYEQLTAQSGLELRRLDGRHDLGLRLMLPLGAGLDQRRMS